MSSPRGRLLNRLVGACVDVISTMAHAVQRVLQSTGEKLSLGFEANATARFFFQTRRATPTCNPRVDHFPRQEKFRHMKAEAAHQQAADPAEKSIHDLRARDVGEPPAHGVRRAAIVCFK